MDLKRLIEREHSKKQTLQIVDYVGSSQVRLNKLMKLFYSGDNRIIQRASWPLTIIAERHPALISPHVVTLLGLVENPHVHDAVRRNIMRLLQFVDIPKRQQGKVVSIAFQFLQDKTQPVAVKVFAMTVLGSIVNEYPELAQELRLTIEEQLPYGSPGFISRARKTLSGMAKQEKANQKKLSF